MVDYWRILVTETTDSGYRRSMNWQRYQELAPGSDTMSINTVHGDPLTATDSRLTESRRRSESHRLCISVYRLSNGM